jgi:hypothetical protein
MLPAMSSDHHGLTLRSVLGYKCTGKSRNPREQVMNIDKAPYVRKVRFNLPLLATPETWHRHNYSLDDVKSTLELLSCHHLWKLASLLGITTPYFAVQPTFATRTDVKFSDKTPTLLKIMNYVKSNYVLSSRNVLDRSHEKHNPPLPAHNIPAHEYERLRAIVSQMQKPWSYLHDNHINFDFYPWKDIFLVPISLEKNHIYCMRVVPWSVLVNSGRDHSPMCNRPLRFIRNNQCYAALTDESCFLLPC